MILYYALSVYHLLSAILHKIDSNYEKDAVLIISDVLPDGESYKKKIVRSGLFKDVQIIPDREIKAIRTRTLNEKSSYEEIFSQIKLQNSALKKHLKYSLHEFGEIYLSADHWPLGVYCITNNIKYNFFEDANGMLCKPQMAANMVKLADINMYVISQQIKAFGLNENVVRKFADLSNQEEDFFDELAVDFSISNILKGLTTGKLDIVKQIFEVPSFSSESNEQNAILLTQHFANLNKMTLMQQRLLYALLTDYFLDNHKVYVKTHPMDIHLDYSKLIDGSTVIPGNFPSELIPYSIEGKFSTILTASSTAVFALINYVDKAIYFTPEIEESFQFIHKYYLSMQLLNRLEQLIDLRYDYFALGSNIELLNQLGNNAVPISSFQGFRKIISKKMLAEISGNSFTVIGNIYSVSDLFRDDIIHWLYGLDENDVVIFLNTTTHYSFYDVGHEALLDHMTCLYINKEKKHKNALGDIDQESVFIFCKNKNLRDQLELLVYSKKLSNTGIEIHVNRESRLTSNELDVKKAILDVTFERLEQYYLSYSGMNEEKYILNTNLESADWILKVVETRLLEYIHKIEKGAI